MDLHFVLPLALVPAVLLGYGLKRLGLPVVVGQILAGVIMGPALLDLIPPFPHESAEIHRNGVFELAQIGLCVLLFDVGLDTGFRQFAKVWRPSLTVAIIGMVLPFALGWTVAIFFGWPDHAALFVGAALTATSIGVTASVVEELSVSQRKEVHVIMGAAIVDDVLGLLLLAVVAGLTAAGTESGGGSVALQLVGAVVFLALALTLGRYFAMGVLRIERWLRTRVVLLVLAFAYLVVLATLAKKMGLAAIIGAYSAGLAFAQHPEHEELKQKLEPLTELLAPLFFIFTGSSIAITALDGPLLIAALAFLVAAIAGKMAAPLPLPTRDLNRRTIGAGLVPRGEVGLIFAQVGLTSGALAVGHYSALALVIVGTTLIGPVLFRQSLAKI
jgi:Kef-type K+ transport system membrane component KefB